MRSIIIALAAVAAGGCVHAPVAPPEVTLLFGPRYSEGETEIGAALILLQEFGRRGHGVGGLLHDSELLNGQPIERKPEEVTFDQPSIGVRWGGRRD